MSFNFTWRGLWSFLAHWLSFVFHMMWKTNDMWDQWMNAYSFKKHISLNGGMERCYFLSSVVFLSCYTQYKYILSYLSKSYTTIFTFCLNLLPRITLGANQLRDRLAVEVVLLFFIMTVPAHIQFVATGSLKYTKYIFI